MQEQEAALAAQRQAAYEAGSEDDDDEERPDDEETLTLTSQIKATSLLEERKESSPLPSPKAASPKAASPKKAVPKVASKKKTAPAAAADVIIKLPPMGPLVRSVDANDLAVIDARLATLKAMIRASSSSAPATSGKMQIQPAAAAAADETARLVERFKAIRASLVEAPMDIAKVLHAAKDVMDNKKVPLQLGWIEGFNAFMNRKDVRAFLARPENALLRDMIHFRIDTRIIKKKN